MEGKDPSRSTQGTARARRRYASEMKMFIFLCAAFLLHGCGIPRDPDESLERIVADKEFRVGLIASGKPQIGQDRIHSLLGRIAKRTGATPRFETGASEPLLLRLEEGALDLVIGELAPDSPWAKRISLMPPLAEQTGDHGQILVAARNGENAWITLVDQESRAVAALP